MDEVLTKRQNCKINLGFAIKEGVHIRGGGGETVQGFNLVLCTFR